MIVVSYNIKEGGSVIKRKRIGLLNQFRKADVCFLQETKLQNFNEKMEKEMWGDREMEWTHSDSDGASGGTVILWRPNAFVPILSFKGDGYVGIKVIAEGVCINFLKVYASCNSRIRREIWRDIESRIGASRGEEWCVGGDFNTVALEDERIGLSKVFNRRDMAGFNDFIENMDLVDLPCVGKKFMWFSGSGSSMSRLDTILVSDKLVIEWKLENQFVWKRELSDHCPVWIKGGG